MRSKLEAAAKKGSRSLHQEIMMRLEASLGISPPADLADQVADHERRLAALEKKKR